MACIFLSTWPATHNQANLTLNMLGNPITGQQSKSNAFFILCKVAVHLKPRMGSCKQCSARYFNAGPTLKTLNMHANCAPNAHNIKKYLFFTYPSVVLNI